MSKEKNQAYQRKMMDDFSRRTRAGRAYIALAGLQAAMLATWQDTGKFVSRWGLQYGSTTKLVREDFYVSPISVLRSKRKQNVKTVRAYMQKAYGFRDSRSLLSSSLVKVTAAGSGGTGTVRIFNDWWNESASDPPRGNLAHWKYAVGGEVAKDPRRAVKSKPNVREAIKKGVFEAAARYANLIKY